MKNYTEIERHLIGNGHLIAENKRRQTSLSRADRAIIGRVRQEAIDAGFSRNHLNALEMEGELGAKGLVAESVEAIFIGLQPAVGNINFRFYNIRGNHPQNNSTVCVTTLVHERIRPKDLTLAEIAGEYLKEFCVMKYVVCENFYYDVRNWSRVNYNVAKLYLRIQAIKIKSLFKGGK